MTTETTTVCVIGSGFSGLCAAIRLKQAGIDDLVVLERADAVGGTWRDNRYPGCACDVRSHLYSLSFAPNPGWTRRYAGWDEIRAYLERVTDAFGVRPHLRFGANVTRATWNEGAGAWTVEVEDGRRFRARFLVNALGALRDARVPDLPGQGSFTGRAIHSAAWPADVDLAGKRVGVVGSGASAIQVVPSIAEDAGHVHVFQRTPPWVVPRKDRAYSALERALFRSLPGFRQLVRAGIYLDHESRYPLAFGPRNPLNRATDMVVRRWVRDAVPDPALRARVMPDYAPGCKRILLSDDWYPALARDDVTLHGAVASVRPTGVTTAAGDDIDLDLLVWCTGYRVDEPLGDLVVQGRVGRDLGAYWGNRPRAFLGMTVPGFPNAFLLLGPNTGLGHNSVVIMSEAQVDYVVQAIRHAMDQGPRAWIDVRPERLDAWIDWVDSRLGDMVWATGCASWYLNEDGQNFTVWPGTTLSYRWRVRRFEPTDFVRGQAG